MQMDPYVTSLVEKKVRLSQEMQETTVQIASLERASREVRSVLPGLYARRKELRDKHNEYEFALCVARRGEHTYEQVHSSDGGTPDPGRCVCEHCGHETYIEAENVEEYIMGP